jgi:hypothetical protein
MLVNFILSCTYCAYVFRNTFINLPQTLPIQCAWIRDPDNARSPLWGLGLAGALAAHIANLAILSLATFYLHYPGKRFPPIVRTMGLGVTIVFALGACTRAMLLSQAFGRPNVQLADMAERNWDHGQRLAMLLLPLPLISAVQIWRGELKIPKVYSIDDTVPLTAQVSGSGRCISCGREVETDLRSMESVDSEEWRGRCRCGSGGSGPPNTLTDSDLSPQS